MKKVLAIFLALVIIMSVALVACGKKDSKTSNNDDENGEEFVVKSNDSETTTDTNDTDGGKKNNVWEAANYTVYAMANGLNIRSAASTTGTKLGTANIGDSFTASEKNDEWYKITYYVTTAYISIEFVTAVANEAQFNNDAEPTVFTIAASQNGKKMNLRVDPAVVEDTLGMTFEVGKTPGTITKVGQNAAGNWFIVEYDEDGAGEKVPVKYYLKITSQTSEILGLTSGGANGYS